MSEQNNVINFTDGFKAFKIDDVGATSITNMMTALYDTLTADENKRIKVLPYANLASRIKVSPFENMVTENFMGLTPTLLQTAVDGLVTSAVKQNFINAFYFVEAGTIGTTVTNPSDMPNLKTKTILQLKKVVFEGGRFMVTFFKTTHASSLTEKAVDASGKFRFEVTEELYHFLNELISQMWVIGKLYSLPAYECTFESVKTVDEAHDFDFSLIHNGIQSNGGFGKLFGRLAPPSNQRSILKLRKVTVDITKDAEEEQLFTHLVESLSVLIMGSVNLQLTPEYTAATLDSLAIAELTEVDFTIVNSRAVWSYVQFLVELEQLQVVTV